MSGRSATDYTHHVSHSVDLSELQMVVGKYVDQYRLLAAAGPVTVAGATRYFVGKSKLLNTAVAGGAAWMAVMELSGPMLRLMEGQFGYLQLMFASFRG